MSNQFTLYSALVIIPRYSEHNNMTGTYTLHDIGNDLCLDVCTDAVKMWNVAESVNVLTTRQTH